MASKEGPGLENFICRSKSKVLGRSVSTVNSLSAVVISKPNGLARSAYSLPSLSLSRGGCAHTIGTFGTTFSEPAS